MVQNFEDIFIRFGATHERDRRTDGRTDRHRMPAIAALCIASHGKHCFHQMTDFKGKMHQIRLQRSPRPLAGFGGPTSKGRGGERREYGRGGERRERKEWAMSPPPTVFGGSLRLITMYRKLGLPWLPNL